MFESFLSGAFLFVFTRFLTYHEHLIARLYSFIFIRFSFQPLYFSCFYCSLTQLSRFNRQHLASSFHRLFFHPFFFVFLSLTYRPLLCLIASIYLFPSIGFSFHDFIAFLLIFPLLNHQHLPFSFHRLFLSSAFLFMFLSLSY